MCWSGPGPDSSCLHPWNHDELLREGPGLGASYPAETERVELPRAFTPTLLSRQLPAPIGWRLHDAEEVRVERTRVHIAPARLPTECRHQSAGPSIYCTCQP